MEYGINTGNSRSQNSHGFVIKSKNLSSQCVLKAQDDKSGQYSGTAEPTILGWTLSGSMCITLVAIYQNVRTFTNGPI